MKKKNTRGLRLPPDLESAIDGLARARGRSFSTEVREALREHVEADKRLDEMANLEQRLAGSLTRLMKDVRLLRNDVHLAMAFTNALAETYLLHTPPLPPEAVDAAGASATDRHAKYLRRVMAQLQGGEGLWSAVSDVAEETDGDSVDE